MMDFVIYLTYFVPIDLSDRWNWNLKEYDIFSVASIQFQEFFAVIMKRWIWYEIKLKEQQDSQGNQKKSQGSSDPPAEKIPTYNKTQLFMQSCASMQQRQLLDELVDSLGTAAR
ncbi:hypothetical protein L2E82_20810 [Cichorium intybus]|uniref:Uncharacterized protein n=1 Tax=Cichorium intybus TaxID=13427 RepID=A0ACB9DUF9_CICIN|nr:hypothetical protein L2E82_20810 [Cichorium intybus]